MLTNPLTGETKNMRQWAIALKISPATFCRRVEVFTDPQDIFGQKKRDYQQGCKWSKPEDSLLLDCFYQPSTIKKYKQKATKCGYPDRTPTAITSRIHVLRLSGLLSFKSGLLEKEGLVTFHQLAQLLNVGDGVIISFTYRGLRYQANPEHGYKYIDLRRFAKWATTPVGRELVATAIKQDKVAIATVLEIISKWFWLS